ncbi:MAG: hypothetical protein AMK71_07880 [Nitrospira bacterium SG8_35_4]|nr:MAG: hypothetical protein AMK71_07880 [Nitrospira bacterium SG8_35_4]
MLTQKSDFKIVFVIIALLLSVYPLFAQDETVQSAEKLMIWQLEALKSKDYRQFIEHGNKAFKEFMDEYSFDSLIMQRRAKIEKGYSLEYLGAIRSIGMRKHLWKVHITGDKYQLLGSLSLSQGKVVGFNLE